MAKIIEVHFDDEAQALTVSINCKTYELPCGKEHMLDPDGDPRFDDEEDFVMHSMLLDESEVEEVVPLVAEAVLPFIECYLPAD